jgi:curli biogenesis system outer membrane secretion channel CsgG
VRLHVSLLAALLLYGSALPPASAATSAVTPPTPDVGQTETVAIRAVGRGKIASEAVDEAIKSAILQANGTTVDMSSEQFHAALGIAIGKDEVGLRSAGFAELVSQRSRGAITNFRIVSLTRSDAEQLYIATIEANVAKYRPSVDSQKIKVVIAPIRVQTQGYQVGNDLVPAAQVAAQLRQQVTNELTQTGRFAVLDRDFSAEVASELELISSGQAPSSEYGKLGQSLSADLVWVGQIDSLGYKRQAHKLATSDRELVSYSGGATLSHRLINIATRQIVFSDSVATTAAPTGPTTLGVTVDSQKALGQLEEGLALQIVPAIVMRMFPVTVVSRNGNAVVLSQGGKAVREHASYQIVMIGQETKDPQTGQSLGRLEQPCCVVDIERVTPTMSYGTLRNVSVNLDRSVSGGLQLRQLLTATRDPPSPPPAAAVATTPTAPPAASTQAPPMPVPVNGNAVPSPEKDKNW